MSPEMLTVALRSGRIPEGVERSQGGAGHCVYPAEEERSVILGWNEPDS